MLSEILNELSNIPQQAFRLVSEIAEKREAIEQYKAEPDKYTSNWVLKTYEPDIKANKEKIAKLVKSVKASVKDLKSAKLWTRDEQNEAFDKGFSYAK